MTMSLDAPVDLVDISLLTKHPHETLGLVFNKDMMVLSCTPGTPSAKIKGWRHIIKGTPLVKINGKPVHSKHEVVKTIDCNQPTNMFQFVSVLQTPLHPETGTTQITFDQFITIAVHHQDICTDTSINHDRNIDKSLLDPAVN